MNDTLPAVALMTVKSPDGTPSLAEAAKQLGVDPGDMDTVFGVVPIDPEEGLYAVQIEGDKVSALPAVTDRGSYRGPWARPSIAPFGPLQDGPEDKGAA